MMISLRRVVAASAASAVTLAMGASLVAPASATTRPFTIRPNAAAVNAFSVLHTFTGSDGLNPTGDLDIAVKNNGNNNYSQILWGEALGGGTGSSGTIFNMQIGSKTFTTTYNFTGNNDGGLPYRGLANNESNDFASGSMQYGVAISGGAMGQGTIFSVSGSGAVKTIYTFTGGNDGAAPASRLTEFTDGNYYGTTTAGGQYGFGTVFKITTAGALTTLHAFTGLADGASPAAGLSLRVNLNGKANVAHTGNVNEAIGHARAMNSQYVSSYLYGTTSAGGTNNLGTIFRLTSAGWGSFQTLYNFTNTSGGSPQAKLSTDLNGNLYGTTSVAGSANNGTVFVLAQGNNTPKILYDFGNGATGSSPLGQILVAFNGNLYGTTSMGGADGFGTIFEISSKGVFSDIHDFANTEGATPQGGLVDGANGFAYGLASAGGSAGDGTLFSIAE